MTDDDYHRTGRPAVPTLPTRRMVGTKRRPPKWRRYPGEELRRRRALAVARAEYEAAVASGDDDVARAFRHVIDSLEPPTETNA